MYLQSDSSCFLIPHLKGNCSFQRDPWGMVSQAELCRPVPLQILAVMSKCLVLHHKNRYKKGLLEVFCFSSHGVLLRSWSNELSPWQSRLFLNEQSAMHWFLHCTTLWICCRHKTLKCNSFFPLSCGSLAPAMSSQATKASWSPVQLQPGPTQQGLLSCHSLAYQT